MQNKGRALLVGGAVRDVILDLPIKDIDIEVYGLSERELEIILQQFGSVNLVGKSFGVLRVNGLDVDWSLPRADKAGRKPEVIIDPYMFVENALRLRDLTMNAMAFDIITNELIDPFNGKEDIKNKILRTPDISFFVQDPLRFFRVMRFIGVFEMFPDDQLNEVCLQMDISTISRERIEQEFYKLFLYAHRPSLGIRWMKNINRLHDVLPELADTIGIIQEYKWHPEGDVFEHSMQTLDAAAIIAQKYTTDFEKLVLLYAALCHDLGKVKTTTVIDGQIKSYSHEIEGVALTKKMLKRIIGHIDLITKVATMVRFHMTPLQFVANKASLAAYKRLAHKMAPHITMNQLIDLALADKRGRNCISQEPLSDDFPAINTFLERTKEAQVQTSPIKPLLRGPDIAEWVQPGPLMGKILKKAYQMQLSMNISDKNELLKQLLPLLKNLNNEN